VPKEVLDHVAKAGAFTWPLALRTLLETWGPGSLAGVFELLDPSTEDWRAHQRTLATGALGAHARGAWAELTVEALRSLVVVGRDRRGAALAVDANSGETFVLHPQGWLPRFPEFESFVRSFLLGGWIERARDAVLRESRYWVGPSFLASATNAIDLGVPAIHSVGAHTYREELLDALRSSDESRADDRLAQLLEREVALFELLALLGKLAGEDGANVRAGLRADYFEQVARMARRRAPELADQIPFEAIREQLARGMSLSAEAGACLRVNTVLDPPTGPFAHTESGPRVLTRTSSRASQRLAMPPSAGS